jgi:hypothetical protein
MFLSHVQSAVNKHKHMELGMLSPFSLAAKKTANTPNPVLRALTV